MDDYDSFDFFGDSGDSYDFSDFDFGGGDMTYFGDNTTGDTSWIDNFDWGGAMDSLDFSGLDLSSFGFGGPLDLSEIDLGNLAYVDQPALPSYLSDYYSDSVSTPAIDMEGNLSFFNPDGTVVTYADYMTPGSLVSTMDPETGRNAFYHTTDGRDYFVDYTDLTPGSLVETFSRDVGGVGPTRYDAYHGTGNDAYHVTYSDVYGPRGGTITTSGADGSKYQYENGKVYRLDDQGNRTRVKEPSKSLMQQLQQIVDARRINMAKRAMPDLSSSAQGRGGAYTPLYSYGPAPLSQIDLGSIANIFPAENVIDRLSGQMPIRVAEGGSIEGHNPEFYSEGGSRYVRGDGDGTSDSVPAMLARGEYVIPADVVSSIGNGDNEAGAEIMDKFLSSVREHKRGAHPEDLPEDSKGPLAYLAEAKKNVRD